MPRPYNLDTLIELAISEDIPDRDITTDAIFGENSSKHATAQIIANEELILSGSSVFKRFWELFDVTMHVSSHHDDGDSIQKGDVVFSLSGNTSHILSGERVSLNFLQHLSGIATHTKKFVDVLRDTKIQILDTRKTTPGLRSLEKEAVVHGGAYNHRKSLSDAILIKDNHIQGAGTIENAMTRCKDAIRNRKPLIPIEIEIDRVSDIEIALRYQPDIILLDNMSIPDIERATLLINGRSKIEVSGGVTRENLHLYKNLTIDTISIGSLIKGAKYVDFSLELIQDT